MTESCLEKFVVPQLLSKVGRLVVLALYVTMTVLSVQRFSNVEIYWSEDL